MNTSRNQRRHGAAQQLAKAAFTSTVLAGLIGQAYAQTAAPAAKPEAKAEAAQTIEVTGFRSSLTSAANAKREAIGLSDSIYAEDMGKFPDNNIAESIARIPGVTISREVTGEGLNIQIRGLGSSFTRVLMNGAPVASASTGLNNFGQANREVDLDFLPADLFTKITVSKSPDASMLEGGIAGTVDMRTARPFDKKGQRGFISVQGTKNDPADKWGHRGAAMVSNTFGDFGILAGLAWGHNVVSTRGFESVGYTNANLSATQSTSTTRNNTGGGNYSIPATVPTAAAGTYTAGGKTYTLTAGQTINQALLLQLNPGATIEQLDNGLIARLPRPVNITGDRDRTNGVLSLEWKPNGNLSTYFDVVLGEKNNKLLRTDINVAVRNNQLIPIGQTFDNTSCTIGCVITSGTYANAQAFLEYRQWLEKTKFWSANPGFEWQLNDAISIDGQFSATRSNFSRETPTLLITTNPATPATINYTNDGSLPSYTSSLNLNDPANFGWYAGNNLTAFYEGRMVSTKGGRMNLKWSTDPSLTLKAGASYDDIARRIVSFNDNGRWATAARAAVPTASVKNYLSQDANGYVNLNWDAFRSISGYETVAASNTETSSGTNAGTTPGFFEERISAAYAQATGSTKLFGNKLRYDTGVRFTSTEQIIGTISGSAATLAESRQQTRYTNALPNASFAYNILADVVGRGSLSKSITRADPSQMRVLSLAFTDPAASSGTLTNAGLKPYTSTNLDLGLEWYTGKGGYLAAAYFAKDIKNFTASVNTTVPFSALAQYGVTYATLTAQQQTAIDNRGGPANTTVTLSQQQNTTDLLHIRGLELTWSQPLDVVLPIKGFGFTTNYTRVKQDGGPSGFIATGVAPWTANFTGYYEDGRASIRVSHTITKGAQLTVSPQNGLSTTAAQLYSNDYKQTDLSTRLEIGDWVGWKPGVSLSFDIWNLGKAVQRQYFQQSNAAYQAYDPGRSYFAGIRAKF